MDARVKPGHDEFEFLWRGWSVRAIRATFARLMILALRILYFEDLSVGMTES